jgi:hypothetical protein
VGLHWDSVESRLLWKIGRFEMDNLIQNLGFWVFVFWFYACFGSFHEEFSNE